MNKHKIDAKMGRIWCPLCWEGVRGRQAHRGHLGDYMLPRKGVRRLPLHKPSANGSSGAVSSKVTYHGTWLASFPSLWEFLTSWEWPDKTRRETGTLLIFLDGPSLKACLKDKNGPRTCFVTAPDPDTLLLAVEEGLAADTLDWRPDKPNSSRK